MEERQFEATVYEYLTLEKAYPKTEIQVEAALGTSADGRRYRADLAILDSKRSEIIALIEVKQSREHKALRSAAAQLLHYRSVLGKPYVPLYLFFPTIPGSRNQFQIAQILPDGDTKDIFSNEFPSYDALISGDKSNKKATRTVAVKATVDKFQITCVLLSITVAILLGLDVAGLMQLSTKQLGLAGLSGALLILPFAAKFKMLGVEFERHNPTQVYNNES